MKENSIEEDIKRIEYIFEFQNKMSCQYVLETEDKKAIEHILSDYKRVLKENEMYKKNSEIMSKENLSTAEQLKVEIKENFRLKNQLENNQKEYQETYKDVREELKELKKENEELKISNKEIDKECSRLEKKEVELEKEKLNTIELINKLKLESRITELENVIIQAIDELKNVNFYEPRLRNKNQKEVNKAYSILFDALKTKES